MKKVQSMIISLSIITLLNGCAGLPAQKVTLSKESVQAIKAEKKELSRSARFLRCLKRLHHEGIKQSLLISMCEAAMGSIKE